MEIQPKQRQNACLDVPPLFPSTFPFSHLMMVSAQVCFAVLLASFASAASASTPVSILFQQCWHERPFTTVNLQTSHDRELVFATRLNYFATLPPRLSRQDRVKELNYGPWSYPPVCTKVLQSVGDKLCVYTNTSFSGGRGISLFTTPRIAEEIATLPPFQDPDALKSKDVNVFSDNWHTQEIPGKGVGMLAKKQLKFKDRVTAYTPALVAYLEGELETLEREKFFRIALSQLPEATRQAYLGLTYIYGLEQIRVQDIVKANTFQLEVAGQNHLSVFPETSRLNHACAPK